MQKILNQTKEGVKISFLGEVKKDNIVTMVQNCQGGKCECMSDETKKKISNIEVEGEDGSVELSINGDITKEEIEQAMEKSKVLNQQCC